DVAGHRAGAEDADFAHLVRTDATGGEVGDAAVGKAQARVGDVLRFAQHRDADRVHARDGAFYEGEDNIQVMNHQIEHDPDVRAAGRVRREPVGLDEARRGGHRFEVFEDRIESFDVAHLEQGAVLLGKL